MIKRISAVLGLAACGFLTSCVTPSPLVTVGPPGNPGVDSPYAGETVYLQSFAVKSKDHDPAAEQAMKQKYVDYLGRVGGFEKVIDATAGTQIPPTALSMTAEIHPSIKTDDNPFIDYYAIFILGILTQRKGTVTVSGSSVIARGRKALGDKAWTCNQDYKYYLMGWINTAPIQDAYRTCYEETFAKIAVPSRAEGAPAVSKAELKSLVEDSVKKATTKEEKVWHSDVDKPSYKSAAAENDFAVVVGIEKYQQIAQADFGERDAQIVKEHLLALGYPQRNIVYLGGDMATKSNMEKYIESWLPAHVKPDSKVLFYFSGHGAPDIDSKQAFLVPWDGDPKFLQKTGYPLKRLYQGLNALSSKKVVVLLDSCFSGAGGRSVLPQGARPLVSKIDDGANTSGKLAILSAAEADEISLSAPDQGHGLFTYYLLKGLNDKKGAASVKDLYDYLVPRVQDGARQQNRDQTPKLVSGDDALAAQTLRD